MSEEFKCPRCGATLTVALVTETEEDKLWGEVTDELKKMLRDPKKRKKFVAMLKKL